MIFVRVAYLFLVFTISGCYKNITSETSHAAEEVHVLEEQCIALNQIGDVKILMEIIDSDMKKINELADNGKTPKDLNKIKLIAERVNKNTTRLRSLIDSQYAILDQTQNVVWEIDLNKVSSNVQEIRNVVFEKILLGAEEDVIKKDQFKTDISNNIIQVQLSRPASLIEICQFEKYITVLLKVEVLTHSQGLKF